MNTINVAQIGVGYWGPNLLRNLVRMEEFRVGIVVDTAEDRRAYVESMYPGIRTSQRATEVWENPEIDAVVIATPAVTHKELVESAILAGKHVLVEKPPALSTADVDQLVTLSESSGVLVMVGHTFLYNPAVAYLKELVSSGELGALRYLYS
ncbi:MAG: Gfo/Idh/MocA family oxidoreductase, partial [Gemmatimonadota bacterium]